VLEPEGALPEAATQLDPHPDLWDGEARLAVSHLVLSGGDIARLRARHGHDPSALRAALLASVLERGGLTEVTADAVLVGTLRAKGRTWSQPVAAGTIVATAFPAPVAPLWLTDISAWDGAAAVVACRGHAIVATRAPVVAFVEPVDAASAALIAREVGVPMVVSDVTVPGDRVAVIGATTLAGALAAVTAARGGAGLVAGVVPSLQDARLARVLGVGEPIIADTSRPSEAAAAVATALGGAADVVAVAVDDPGAVTTAVLLAGNGTVLLLTGRAHAELAARTAAGLGTAPVIRVDRPGVVDAGVATTGLVTSVPTLTELVRWRAGVGPAPTATRPEDV
jgi:hypothetical protein